MTNILNYYGEAHTPFLHARGRSATLHLIRMIDCQPGEKILEIGFGTGATLALLADEHKNSEFYGAELSGKMLEIATRRLKFCGLRDKVSLGILPSSSALPYKENYFDKIYIESVLAIQPGDKLKTMLAEIKRILKPKGILVMNETIWLQSTSPQKIDEVNQFCLRSFGIIQANETYPYLLDWQKLLKSLNFEILHSISLDILKPDEGRFTKRMLRSDLFTAIGKFKLIFNPQLRNDSSVYQNQMNILAKGQTPLMQGYLIKTKVNK